jgi:predicted DsbA family dithiol-disulfide isomerase
MSDTINNVESAPSIKIDFYSEITCPWCFLGQYRLDKVLAEKFPGLAVDIEHHPVILMPDCPPEGLNVLDLLRSKGVPDPETMLALPQEEARASGLDFDRSLQPFAYPTQGAHTLLRHARARGSQHALAWALRLAYFKEALNISDPDVLSGIAAGHGFGRDEAVTLVRNPAERATTEAEAMRSRSAGVTTVPAFVFGKGALVGGQSETDMERRIREALQ